MLVIRLARRGRKKIPFYDLVVAEKSQAVQKKIVEKLGYYNPLAKGGEGELVFDAEKLKKYIGNGAHPSQTVARLLVKNGVKEVGKFIEERKTKPKKEKKVEEKKEETPPAEAAEGEAAPTETPEEKAEESAPAEEATETKPEEEPKKESDSVEASTDKEAEKTEEAPTEEVAEDKKEEKSE